MDYSPLVFDSVSGDYTDGEIDSATLAQNRTDATVEAILADQVGAYIMSATAPNDAAMRRCEFCDNDEIITEAVQAALSFTGRVTLA